MLFVLHIMEPVSLFSALSILCCESVPTAVQWLCVCLLCISFYIITKMSLHTICLYFDPQKKKNVY